MVQPDFMKRKVALNLVIIGKGSTGSFNVMVLMPICSQKITTNKNTASRCEKRVVSFQKIPIGNGPFTVLYIQVFCDERRGEICVQFNRGVGCNNMSSIKIKASRREVKVAYV